MLLNEWSLKAGFPVFFTCINRPSVEILCNVPLFGQHISKVLSYLLLNPSQTCLHEVYQEVNVLLLFQNQLNL